MADVWDIIAGVGDFLTKGGSAIYDRIYQAKTQQEQYEREDNAVQRRVEDLENSGLNPALAHGSSAGVGSVVSRNNSEFGSALDTMSAINQIRSQKNDLDIQQKQKEYLDQQIKYQRFANNQIDFNNNLNQMLMLQGLGFTVQPKIEYNNGVYNGIEYDIGGKWHMYDDVSYFTPSGTNIYFLENEMNARNLINSAAMLQWDKDFYGANKTFKNIVFPTLNAAIGGVSAGAKLYGVTH